MRIALLLSAILWAALILIVWTFGALLPLACLAALFAVVLAYVRWRG